ncbi:hypothetical protein H4219_005962 [Mycoemilia scoparia]|uniref:Uncharacterized protein n=1 Tax=Mycoemilia scoparia TaxID=417184 RepID=A0A9W7ZLV7_9FUNG|nr:hypothetical protein H4219_005962 [Mycoemilia scoparia]
MIVSRSYLQLALATALATTIITTEAATAADATTNANKITPEMLQPDTNGNHRPGAGISEDDPLTHKARKNLVNNFSLEKRNFLVQTPPLPNRNSNDNGDDPGAHPSTTLGTQPHTSTATAGGGGGNGPPCSDGNCNGGGVTKDPVFDDDGPPITWLNVVVAGVLLLVNVFMSHTMGLGISRSLIISALRCVCQLTVMALILREVFLTQNPFYIFGMTIAIGAMAAYEVTFWRNKQRFAGMYFVTFVSILTSTLVVGLIGNAFAMNMRPAYKAHKFIPTMGMLLGNCMVGMSIGISSAITSLKTHRDRIETYLAFGATRWEIARPVVTKALREALMPTINNMSITGLISIPGMMTGQILGGVDVLEASHAQEIILFLITASTAMGTFMSVISTVYVVLDNNPRLCLERLTANGQEKSSAGGRGAALSNNSSLGSSRSSSSKQLGRLQKSFNKSNEPNLATSNTHSTLAAKNANEFEIGKNSAPARYHHHHHSTAGGNHHPSAPSSTISNHSDSHIVSPHRLNMAKQKAVSDYDKSATNKSSSDSILSSSNDEESNLGLSTALYIHP